VILDFVKVRLNALTIAKVEVEGSITMLIYIVAATSRNSLRRIYNHLKLKGRSRPPLKTSKIDI